MPNIIASFDGEHAFLSNFFPAIVTLDGLTFRTVEHAFQAAKTDDRSERIAIQQAETPGLAKRMGRRVTLVNHWDAAKDNIMIHLLRQKFSPGSPLALGLDSTGDATLVEGNNWHDNYWGVCTCPECGGIGANVLGQLLMRVRAENRTPKPPLFIEYEKRRWLP